MHNFDEHLDEMNDAIDMVLAYAPEVDDRTASRIVTAFYSAGFRIAKLQPTTPTGQRPDTGKGGRPAKYDWSGMDLGSVRYFPDGPDMRGKLNSSVRQFAARHAADTRYSVTSKDGRWAVTRIA